VTGPARFFAKVPEKDPARGFVKDHARELATEPSREPATETCSIWLVKALCLEQLKFSGCLTESVLKWGLGLVLVTVPARKQRDNWSEKMKA
jgi:hypothetical protein